MAVASLPAGVRSETAEVDGALLHWYEAGSGSPVVLLHDLTPGVTGWLQWRPVLELLAQGRRVIALDLPGFGESDTVVLARPRADHAADALAGLLDTLGIDRADVVGGGPGANTASWFAVRHPKRCGRLAMIGGAAGISLFSPFPHDVPHFNVDAQANPNDQTLRRLLEAMVHDRTRITDALVGEFVVSVQAHPEHVASVSRTPVMFHVGQMLNERIDDVAAPTLVLCGREDRATGLESQIGFARYIYDARLVMLPDAGYWAQLDQPAIVADVLAEFLDGARGLGR